jgi:very-short-patch-repair endonuclease
MMSDDTPHPTSSSMEEVAAKRPEEVRPPTVKKKPAQAHSSPPFASPPQSVACATDSSSIEEERGAKSWIRGRAREMRKGMTPHEKAMWRLLHQSELVALNWRKQAAFGDYILDFVSHPARLVIEVDGSQHAQAENAKTDAERTEWLRSEGYAVLRFWNQEALKARDDVWRTIQVTAAATPAGARLEKWRADHLAQVQATNAQIASSSMEEAPRSGGGGAPSVATKVPPEALSQSPVASPPQSVACATDSSSIEEERI